MVELPKLKRGTLALEMLPEAILASVLKTIVEKVGDDPQEILNVLLGCLVVLIAEGIRPEHRSDTATDIAQALMLNFPPLGANPAPSKTN